MLSVGWSDMPYKLTQIYVPVPSAAARKYAVLVCVLTVPHFRLIWVFANSRERGKRLNIRLLNGKRPDLRRIIFNMSDRNVVGLVFRKFRLNYSFARLARWVWSFHVCPLAKSSNFVPKRFRNRDSGGITFLLIDRLFSYFACRYLSFETWPRPIWPL